MFGGNHVHVHVKMGYPGVHFGYYWRNIFSHGGSDDISLYYLTSLLFCTFSCMMLGVRGGDGVVGCCGQDTREQASIRLQFHDLKNV
jgi:hypothetical protein